MKSNGFGGSVLTVQHDILLAAIVENEVSWAWTPFGWLECRKVLPQWLPLTDGDGESPLMVGKIYFE